MRKIGRPRDEERTYQYALSGWYRPGLHVTRNEADSGRSTTRHTVLPAGYGYAFQVYVSCINLKRRASSNITG